jgi:carbon monoxide dehydrogenase subunit G
MRDFGISVDIAATPQRVWEVLTDPERWPEWTPSVTSVELLDRPLTLGSRARIVQPGLSPATFRVTRFDAGKSFTWVTGIPGILVVHAHHSVEPAHNGARATLRLRFDGLLGGVMGKKLQELNNRYLAMEAAGLKRFAEEGPPGPGVSLEQWNEEARRALEASHGPQPADPESIE